MPDEHSGISNSGLILCMYTANERLSLAGHMHKIIPENLLRVITENISKLQSTGPLWASIKNNGFPSQRASNLENISMSWCHHAKRSSEYLSDYIFAPMLAASLSLKQCWPNDFMFTLTLGRSVWPWAGWLSVCMRTHHIYYVIFCILESFFRYCQVMDVLLMSISYINFSWHTSECPFWEDSNKQHTQFLYDNRIFLPIQTTILPVWEGWVGG